MKNTIAKIKRMSGQKNEIPCWLFSELEEDDFLQGKAPEGLLHLWEEED
ncbi:MAG: hypothetical protein HQL12_04500 [Candidatus Omnitrophica bacterium]|nr:hypothetical protein [Candidatus Omnitrophota bacterium]